MRTGMMGAILLATVVVGPAAAQPSDNARGGIRTETESRLADQGGDFQWDLLGLIGLLGLLGLHRPHDEDSYHPAPLE